MDGDETLQVANCLFAGIFWGTLPPWPQNSWFSPPNTSLTDPSVKIWRIELVSRSAQDSTRTLSGAPGGKRNRIGDDDLLEPGGAELIPWMA